MNPDESELPEKSPASQTPPPAAEAETGTLSDQQLGEVVGGVLDPRTFAKTKSPFEEGNG